MTYRVVAHPRVQKEIEKLYKKDKIRYEYIKKKLKILAEQPEIGKPLRNVLKGKWRVQIENIILYNITTTLSITTPLHKSNKFVWSYPINKIYFIKMSII